MKLSKAEQDELDALNSSLSPDDQKELDALNGQAAAPKSGAFAGARAEADASVQPTTPPGKSTNDLVSEAESNDLEEIARLGRDQLGTAYVNGSNLLTLGAANKLRDMDSGSPFPADERAAMDKRNPGAKAAGIGIAALLGGAPKIVDAGARGLVGAALPGLAKSVAGRIAGAGLAGAGSGALQSKALGGDASTGAVVGGALGGGVQAVGEAASGLAGVLKGKGWIGKYDKAKQSGLMDQAEAEAARGELSKDPAGQFAAAGKARDRIMARDEQLAADESAKLSAARAPHLDKPANVNAVRESFDSAVDRLSNGNAVDPGLAEEMKSIGQKLGDNPTNADILAVRRAYQEAAGFGNPAPTESQLRARKIYMALREGLQDSPIGAADREYAQSQLARERRNDLMLGSEDGPRSVELPERPPGAAPPMRKAARANDEDTMAKRLGRLGDTSVEGAPANDRIAKLRAQGDPEINAALDELEARKAWMATRYGVPELPAKFSQAIMWPVRLATHNAGAATARMGLPALGIAGKSAPAAASRAGSAAGLGTKEPEGKNRSKSTREPASKPKKRVSPPFFVRK